MKFFIDTANLAQIKEANELGILDGVTTNPSLMAKEGIKGNDAVMAHYKTICEMVNGDISAEVISTDFKGIVEEGKKLAAIHKNIVVKVPMIKDGVKAYVQTAHFVFLPARPYLLPKPVLLTSPLL
jgi:transaldolase